MTTKAQLSLIAKIDAAYVARRRVKRALLTAREGELNAARRVAKAEVELSKVDRDIDVLIRKLAAVAK